MELSGLAVLLLIPIIAGGAFGETVLVLESWRDDDRTVWRERILPAFEVAGRWLPVGRS